MLIIGCDPGLSGAVALLRDGDLIDVYDIPTLVLPRNDRRKRMLDHVMLAQLFADLNRGRGTEGPRDPIGHVFVEQVGVRPGEGAVGAFSFGQGVGALVQAIASERLAYSFMVPRTWQKAVGLPDGTDDAALDLARRLWPSLLGPDGKFAFGLKKHVGRADAALIGRAGWLRTR